MYPAIFYVVYPYQIKLIIQAYQWIHIYSKKETKDDIAVVFKYEIEVKLFIYPNY